MKKTEKNNHSQVTDFLCHCSERVDHRLKENFSRRKNSYQLIDAIRYSSIGGKKIRPALVYATSDIARLPPEWMDDVACSIELMHAYSLIHDDLPAMDDSRLRRGRPTLHRSFTEAIAILAGDAMQAIAFEMLVNSSTLDDSCKVSAVSLLARAAGTEGMAGGQAMDIALTARTPDIHTVETMHRMKTGSLIAACIHIPLACSGETPPAVHRALSDYASHIGLCFQIQDDILDLETDVINKNKPTYPSTIGWHNAREELLRLSDLCLKSLEPLNTRAQKLRWLTRYIVERST